MLKKIKKRNDSYFSTNFDALPVRIFLELYSLPSHPLLGSRKSWGREALANVPQVGILIWNLSETSPL